jgi:hypothetical protein
LWALILFVGAHPLSPDDPALGVAAAGVAVGFKAPPLLVVIVAATVTALARTLL